MYRSICRSAFRPERQSVLFFIKHKRLLISKTSKEATNATHAAMIPAQSILTRVRIGQRLTQRQLLKPGVSDNVDPCQILFERTAPCTPKSAPFRSS
jgi:hypothetical protein